LGTELSRTGREVRFGTSGVRGVVDDTINDATCTAVGRALGTLLGSGARVCIGRDSRTSGTRLLHWVGSGLSFTGCTVVDAGMLPTPALAAVTKHGHFDAGVMLTASHNPYPPEYNGIKLFESDGLGFSREREQAIESLCASGEFTVGFGQVEKTHDAFKTYLDTIPVGLASAAASSGLKLLVDAGNGAAAGFISEVLRQLGIPVVTVNDMPDGTFPGRGPEPNESTLASTYEALLASGADLAACFDGDADRVVFMDRQGFLGLDGMTSFVAHHRVDLTGCGCIATTVETGMLPWYAVAPLGGHVTRGIVGDVAVAHTALRENAALGAETIGVYIFPEHGLYPESVLAVLHVLAASSGPRDIRDFLGALPPLYMRKHKLPCPAALKQAVMDYVAPDVLVPPGEKVRSVLTVDGLRVELDDSWLLVRPSGTEPVLRVTVESADPHRAEMLSTHATGAVAPLVQKLISRMRVVDV